MADKTCATCRWWNGVGKQEVQPRACVHGGGLRIFPDGRRQGVFLTWEDETCGEHTERDDAPAL